MLIIFNKYNIICQCIFASKTYYSFPKNLIELSLPNMVIPSFPLFNAKNMFLSPLIFFEHPLSIHQWLFVFWACKEIPHSSMCKSSCFFFQIVCCSGTCLFSFEGFEEPINMIQIYGCVQSFYIYSTQFHSSILQICFNFYQRLHMDFWHNCLQTST